MQGRAFRLLPLGVTSLIGGWLCCVFFAAGASAAGGCPNEASPGFRSYLPECRGYEMVTPAFKDGNN